MPNTIASLAWLWLIVALPLGSCSKKDDNSGSGGPVVMTGNEPGNSDETTPQPQPSGVVAPYVGVWENDALTIVFLADGRTAAANRLSGAVSARNGMVSHQRQRHH